MSLGFFSSVSFHVFLLSVGILTLSAPSPLAVADVEALSVEIVPVSSITRTTRGVEEPEETPEEIELSSPEPEVDPVPLVEDVGETEREKDVNALSEDSSPVVEEITNAPVVMDDSSSYDVASLPPEVEEEAKEHPKKLTNDVSSPRRRPTVEVEERDSDNLEDKITALLDKENTGKRSPSDESGLGSRRGRDSTLSRSEMDVLRGQISRCWNVGALAGSDDAATLRASVSFSLNPDGTLSGSPSVSAIGGSTTSRRAFAGGARRAVVLCAPYKKLPREKYGEWSEVVVNFSLNDML